MTFGAKMTSTTHLAPGDAILVGDEKRAFLEFLHLTETVELQVEKVLDSNDCTFAENALTFQVTGAREQRSKTIDVGLSETSFNTTPALLGRIIKD